ncbi:MAG TPA: Rho termination factor N-terminal domain-containing protein, partial [Baekduia sp.]|nr:Rho termination factor N-terminal domain-containing protein [Baekduia sp.]
MAVLNRSTLTESPLADLHELAGELGIEGFRKLRKDDLIGEVLKSQGIEDPGPAPKPAPVADAADARDDEPPSRSRRSRSGRAPRDEDTDAEADPRRVRSRREHGEDVEGRGESRRGSSRGERDSARGGRGRERGRRTPDVDSDSPAQQKVAEGVVEVVANGSGFLRVAPPEASDADIYVSAAQVRRCELVTGDKVSGPVRAPRRSERYSSLVRIDTINGKPTEEVAEGTRFDDFAASYPTERIALNTTDKALKAIDVLVPIGKGTRATIVGAPHAGKSALIRAYAAALTHAEDLETSVVVVGVRPEEIADWPTGPEAPAARLSFTASAEAQGQAVTSALDTARRIAARGGDAVVVIDSLDALPAGVA